MWTKRLPQRDWDDQDMFDVRGAMDRQRGTVAGTDGWSGTEVADLGGIVAPAVAVVFDAFEMAEALPSPWSEARQIHLPKESPPAGGGATPVSQLRPITVFSSWYSEGLGHSPPAISLL